MFFATLFRLAGALALIAAGFVAMAALAGRAPLLDSFISVVSARASALVFFGVGHALDLLARIANAAERVAHSAEMSAGRK